MKELTSLDSALATEGWPFTAHAYYPEWNKAHSVSVYGTPRLWPLACTQRPVCAKVKVESVTHSLK